MNPISYHKARRRLKECKFGDTTYVCRSCKEERYWEDFLSTAKNAKVILQTCIDCRERIMFHPMGKRHDGKPKKPWEFMQVDRSGELLIHKVIPLHDPFPDVNSYTYGPIEFEWAGIL